MRFTIIDTPTVTAAKDLQDGWYTLTRITGEPALILHATFDNGRKGSVTLEYRKDGTFTFYDDAYRGRFIPVKIDEIVVIR